MQTGSGAVPFALIYFTFFLDNVLLTVLVPIIPEWLGAPQSVPAWPLATAGNNTASLADQDEPEASPAVVGLVLGAKAGAQLAAAPWSAGAVGARGPGPVLRGATLLLAGAALGLRACAELRGAACALCVGAARALHGAGAAGAGVAGLALAARALPPRHRDRAIGMLLGAVALGVLVGYPVGGATTALWPRGAPFLLLAAALLADLALQYMFLDAEEYNKPLSANVGAGGGAGVWRVVRVARTGCAGACAGAVLLTTCVMAALEPCLPPWIMRNFHSQHWVVGAVFVPDSAGYLVAASALGGAARALGAERVALGGQLCVGAAALWLPRARSVRELAAPHVALGAGLGATDAALVPALLARHPRDAPALAALLQTAGSGAYALGPALGGAAAEALGFAPTLSALGAANLLYLAVLYRALRAHPLSEQWGATSPGEEEDDGAVECTPLRCGTYTPLH